MDHADVAPMMCSAIFHWDGMGALYRDVALKRVVEQGQLAAPAKYEAEYSYQWNS